MASSAMPRLGCEILNTNDQADGGNLLESKPYAYHDRKRQPGAVVVDAREVGADELIDVGQTADMPQPELRVEVHLVGNLEQDAGVHADREGGGTVVEIVVR